MTLRKKLMMIMTMRKRLIKSLMKLGEKKSNKVNYGGVETSEYDKIGELILANILGQP